MKVYAYRAVQKGPRALGVSLKKLSERPLSNRTFDGRATGLRLEHFHQDGDFVFADFAAARVGHGPGKMSPDTPLADIELGDHESFGEDTGLVLHIPTNYLALQYNHSGPRIGRIAQYLVAADIALGDIPPPPIGQTAFEHAGYNFGAVLKPDAYSRLSRFGIIRELEFEVSLPGAQASDRAAGRSLTEILNAPLPEGVETIKISMRAARQQGGHLGRSGAMQIIDDLQGLGAVVTGGHVTGKQDAEARTEAVDLVQDRLSNEALVTAGHGRRYTRTDRWDALQRILGEWLARGALPHTT